MAISRTTTWNAGDILTAADLNGEFNNIIDNALSLISPLTGNLDVGSNQLLNVGFIDVETAIRDSNQNELLVPSATAAAVNELTIANAAAGANPTLSATGTDTNISLDLRGKGNLGVAAGLRSYLAGLALSNNATDADHDVDIAVGIATDEADGNEALLLTSALTKQIDAAWAVGTNAGGLDTGTVAADTWYHVHLIKRTDTGVVDALFSTSATSPTMPTNYDKRRRIGAVLTDSVANIIAFSQKGDEFLWSSPPLDVDVGTPGTTAVLRTLSVPSGVRVWAIYNALLSQTATAASRVLFSSPDVLNFAPSSTAAPLAHAVAISAASTHQERESKQIQTRTNTSSQIRTRVGGDGGTTVALRIATLGWIDRRGRDD